MISPPPPRRASAPRLPRRFAAVAFAFYMSAIMAMVMSAVITAVNEGIGPGYVPHVLAVYLLAMPVAFCSVLLIRPVVMWLVLRTVKH